MNVQSSPPEGGITLLGLGPGDPEAITRRAWQILSHAQEIYVRTQYHPVIRDLPDGIVIHSFDSLYENAASFEDVYRQIVEQILTLGQRPQGVIYAVPGHPFVAEATGPEIARQARAQGIPVHMVAGLSFLEPVFTALGQDPFPQTVLVDALDLATAHIPPFPPTVPVLVAQLYSRQIASDVKLTLASVYPDEHPVQLVHGAGTADENIENLALYEIDRSDATGLLTALYVPPLDAASGFEAFQEVIAHLRAPDGCPWDREQTHQTLRQSLLEETYEVLSAIDANDPLGMEEELGDLLLQIVMHAQIAAEEGEFLMADVLRGIHHKIVRRHPHVFGEQDIRDTQSVLQNWEKMKAEERQANGKTEAGLLDSIAMALPALIQAEQYQARAARVGFDWPAVLGVYEKIDEELEEVRQAHTPEEHAAEVGDLLFAVVNLARWLKVEPESALREANQRFRKRFSFIEAEARRQGRAVSELTLDEMEALWQAAKREE